MHKTLVMKSIKFVLISLSELPEIGKIFSVRLDRAREWVKRMRNEDSSLIEQRFHRQKPAQQRVAVAQEAGLAAAIHREGDNPGSIRLNNFRDAQMGKKKASGWTGKAGSSSSTATK